ncbi:reverse transcriptase family protein [Escherichia coli]|uniref:reverse transcriptase family protein n=1 Tax=Escherichia coli TaxID=562 RepID=UPI001C3C3F02|nr:reverse transcriptase family protein [Escherichia coli]MBV4692561.1 RNA-directed DNA polymerase [Escherichia coli]MBW4314312.1 reverse transcriptase family protein [Escherichia coli]
MKKRKKLKVNTKNKSYDIMDSPFYKLKSKRKLANLLCVSLDDLYSLRKDEGNYSVFEQLSKKGKARKIQKPLEKLELVHTRIASLLSRIALPEYLHSGKKKCSNVTNAKAHLNNEKMITTDIKAFFPSTTRGMIFSFFFSVMKMSSDVADVLSHICTCHDRLPTGSRISMPLAYFANSRMFGEIYQLCQKLRVNMTVYVDDLTFSGSNVNRLFCAVIRKIVNKHGHVIHPTKTKLYARDKPKLVTGVIVLGNALKVRNEQHFLMAREIDYWKIIKDAENARETIIAKKLFGRLHSMGVIEQRYKSKVLTLKANTAN